MLHKIHAAVLIVAIVFSLSPITGAQTTQPGSDKAPDGKPAMKKVLIIGDSISIGYTPFVTERLKDVAAVTHSDGNAGPTSKGIENINAWLGDTPWDAILFNFGLHDLCHWVDGKKDKVNGKPTVSIEQYEENLEKLVVRLKQTNARLIWADTTHVPEGEPGRYANAEQDYNKVARKVMQKHGIPITDLETPSRAMPAEHRAGKGDVHYKAKGYELLGSVVEEAIRAQLK